MTYRVGELDQRVTIQRLSTVSDGQGGSTESWADVVTVWAHARPRSGREVVQFDRVNGEHAYMFVIRYRSGIRESDRLVWQGVNYNIRAINDQSGRKLYLEIDAERGVAQ